MHKFGTYYILVMLVFAGLTASVAQSVPQWASDQLELRRIVKESIQESQKWQRADGRIFPYLSLYKWDDEPEIFYFWLPYYFLTGDGSVYESVKGAAMAYIDRAVEDNRFDHGYYEDAFFDTEHTLEGMIVLANLAWIKPSDREVVSALEDVIEHVGNWVNGYADWFNYDTKLMRSTMPGTQYVRTNNSSAIDWVYNLQFVKMALALYHANGNARYLDWCKTYMDGWIAVMERNERENGYYVLPSSVDPYTGEIGPYSSEWWNSSFGEGWSWAEKGNNANRDMRGAFLDLYQLTGERKYLEAIKKHIQTLFDNGNDVLPAHLYDGNQWIPDDDKVTVAMAVQASMLDDQYDPDFDSFIQRWYDNLRYPYSEMHLWSYFKIAPDIDKIKEINGYAIYNANKHLEEIQALTSLPDQPDNFPEIGGHWGLSMVPFGGLSAQRGEMPDLRAVYFDSDKNLGLPPGIAGLFERQNDEFTQVSLSNTTANNETIWLQAGFIPRAIQQVYINNSENSIVQGKFARVDVPAHSTVQVRLVHGTNVDNTPPAAPNNLRIVSQ